MRFIIFFAISLAAVVITIVVSGGFLSRQGLSWSDNVSPTLFPSPTPKWIAELTLKEKVGQLFLVGFEGMSLTEETRAFLRENHIGGVLLLGRNIKTPEQVRKLTDDLTSLSIKQPTPLPFLIAIDEEGGRVARLPWPHEQTAQEVIKLPSRAYRIAKKRGQELSSLGINVNLSPVVELGLLPESYIAKQRRAFGRTNQSDVLNLSLAMVDGYKDAGIASIPKHFPGGLGYTREDPHKSLPVVTIESATLSADIELFVGIGKAAEALMVTHLLYPSIDQEPTSLSSVFLNEFLRKQYQFAGLIVSDDIAMAAVSGFSVSEIVEKGLTSGIDMFIITSPQKKQQAAIEAVLALVKSGVVNEARLNQSVERIARFKQRLERKNQP